MKMGQRIHGRHQFRLVLCGHKAVEAGAVCVLLMVQGHLGAITGAHLLVAGKTGLLAIIPVLGVSLTQHARHFVNRWTTSALFGLCTTLADVVAHESHYPGQFTEAVLTGLGAFVFSVAVSYTGLGKRIDRLAEEFLHKHPPVSLQPEAVVAEPAE